MKLTEDQDFCSDSACSNGYDGEDMYRLYQKYRDTTNSWWYDEFGAGGFSVQDFLVLILYYEMEGLVDNDVQGQEAFSYAISEKLSYWCERYSEGSCGGASDNAILNFIATRGSAWKLYDHHVTGGNPFKPERGGKVINHTWNDETGDYNWSVSVAKNVVRNALNSVTPSGSLADWGNTSLGNIDETKFTEYTEATIGCSAENCVLWRSPDNKAYVVTYEQAVYFNTPK